MQVHASLDAAQQASGACTRRSRDRRANGSGRGSAPARGTKPRRARGCAPARLRRERTRAGARTSRRSAGRSRPPARRWRWPACRRTRPSRAPAPGRGRLPPGSRRGRACHPFRCRRARCPRRGAPDLLRARGRRNRSEGADGLARATLSRTSDSAANRDVVAARRHVDVVRSDLHRIADLGDRHLRGLREDLGEQALAARSLVAHDDERHAGIRRQRDEELAERRERARRAPDSDDHERVSGSAVGLGVALRSGGDRGHGGFRRAFLLRGTGPILPDAASQPLESAVRRAEEGRNPRFRRGISTDPWIRAPRRPD